MAPRLLRHLQHPREFIQVMCTRQCCIQGTRLNKFILYSSTALPPLPLPPLPTPAPGQLPPRRARQAKLAAQAITSQQQQNDEGGDEDGDGDGDMDDEEDGAFEDDMLGYDASDFNFDASGMLDHGTPSGSVSPRSNRPRGRKPKASFGAGLNKESNEYQKLRKENHVGFI